MSVPFQPSLFGFGDPMADTSFSTLHRFQLDPASWVDLAPGWLRGADSLFSTLADSAPWQRRERWMYDHRVAEPRLTCGWTVADAPPPLGDLGRVLSQRYGVAFDSIWANYYRDGNETWAVVHRAGRRPAGDGGSQPARLAAHRAQDGSRWTTDQRDLPAHRAHSGRLAG